MLIYSVDHRKVVMTSLLIPSNFLAVDVYRERERKRETGRETEYDRVKVHIVFNLR